MHRYTKVVLAALTATLALAIAVVAASANRLAGNETQFRTIFTSMEFIGGGATVRCPVTLEGSYHSRTISKVVGSLIGYLTKTTVGTCNGGTARANTETLPWHIRYASFTGTLPTIRTISQNIIRSSFTVGILGINCRYTPAEVTAVVTREAGGVATGITFTKENITSETGGFCPNTNRFTGSGSVRTGGGGNITITLVA
jgi:hypothetical protein